MGRGGGGEVGGEQIRCIIGNLQMTNLFIHFLYNTTIMRASPQLQLFKFILQSYYVRKEKK